MKKIPAMPTLRASARALQPVKKALPELRSRGEVLWKPWKIPYKWRF